jgi:hypothetical protein
VLVALAAFAFGARTAAANDASITITCSGVTFNYVFFPDAPNNTVNEVVSVDGVQVATPSFSFNGPSGANTIPLNLTPGDHFISAHVDGIRME